ncbi:MAG: glycosyltransferase family 39 protein [Desulfovibrio sp.]|jgi:4-amino-4-deoxy-L-arabinose transferase-like glycosyltransferase|nr:glycosyltransferase family 39 protein [Desulfovibrio sp.]
MHSTNAQTFYETLREHASRWVCLLILAPLVLRLWFVATGQLNLVQDEAQYWDWTRHLQLTYYSKGPLIAWIIWACTAVFGNTELGVRMGSILGAAVFPALLWLLVGRLWKRPVLGVLAVFIAAVSPLFQALGILMTTDNPFVICWTLSMLALYAATTPDESGRDRGLWPYVLLALAYGVGILAKYTMLGVAGLAVAYGLVLSRRNALPAGYWPKLFIALFVGAVLGFLPTLIWNMQNDFVGYKHVLHLIGVQGEGGKKLFRISRVPEYVGAQLGFALPWWFWFMLVAGWRAALRCFRPANGHAVDTGSLSLQQSALLVVFFWPMTLFFLAWSFHTKVLANWNTVSYVAGAILCATEVERLLRSGLTRRGWAWLKAGAWASVGLMLLLHLHQLLPIPPSINPAHRLKGWDDLGRHMRTVADTRFPDPSRVFFMSDVYDITAELAFYVPGQPQAYCLWWDGRRMNQYDLWGGPKDKIGWDAVLVLRGDAPGVPPVVTEMFERVAGPYRHVASFRGEPVRPFYYYLCTGYKGLWPRQDTGAF